MSYTLTTNEEYAVVCKGWTDNHNVPNELPWVRWYGNKGGDELALRKLPDYTTSDAELGRMVKALAEARYWSLVISAPIVDERWIIHSEELEEIYTHCWEGKTVNEATMRACIALKLQVPDGK